MIQVRSNIWETNSSSVHNLIMCSREDYERLRSGALMITGWNSEYERNRFILRDAALQILEKQFAEDTSYFQAQYGIDKLEDCNDDKLDEIMANEEIAFTLENFGGEMYERFEETFTTPHGDEVISFGYFGTEY